MKDDELISLYDKFIVKEQDILNVLKEYVPDFRPTKNSMIAAVINAPDNIKIGYMHSLLLGAISRRDNNTEEYEESKDLNYRYFEALGQAVRDYHIIHGCEAASLTGILQKSKRIK